MNTHNTLVRDALCAGLIALASASTLSAAIRSTGAGAALPSPAEQGAEPKDEVAIDAPATEPAPAAVPRRSAPVATREHVVAAGETVWTLAVRYGLSVKELRAANDGLDLDALKPGTVVNVPAIAPYSLGEPTKSLQPVLHAELVPAPAASPRPADDAIDADSGNADRVNAEDLEESEIGVPQPKCKTTTPKHAESALAFRWPVDGYVISEFGKRRRRLHKGVDLKAPRGAPVRASRDGWVVFSGSVRGHGRVIVLEHDGGYHTVYAHNQKNMVTCDADGERLIKAGEQIATCGASGNATTPHVHFEIRKDHIPMNPMTFLGGEGAE